MLIFLTYQFLNNKYLYIFIDSFSILFGFVRMKLFHLEVLRFVLVETLVYGIKFNIMVTDNHCTVNYIHTH